MTHRQHIGAQLSQLMAIADAQVPRASMSWATATTWRAIVAYSNERLLGDELDELCAEERRLQAEADERINGLLRVVGFKHWFERWTA
jgi:hypothetical protein